MATPMLTNGLRIGGYVIIADAATGIRYAVRPPNVILVIDADECRDATVLCLAGGRTVRAEKALEEVLTWLSPT